MLSILFRIYFLSKPRISPINTILFSTESAGSDNDHGSIIGKNFPDTITSEPSEGL